MFADNAERIISDLPDDAVVLDVGGWGSPFPRADWVLDLLPYETRGLYGYERSTADERFDADSWVTRDICDHEPWPFADDQFDFAICSHTLEDIRDPVWVCRELARVARAGYIETPSRTEEQSWGVHGPWVGWSHHRWLVDTDGDRLRFVHKPGVLHERDHFPSRHAEAMAPEERVLAFWWESSFQAEEINFFEPDDLHSYLRDLPGAEHLVTPSAPPASRARRSLNRLPGVRQAVQGLRATSRRVRS